MLNTGQAAGTGGDGYVIPRGSRRGGGCGADPPVRHSREGPACRSPQRAGPRSGPARGRAGLLPPHRVSTRVRGDRSGAAPQVPRGPPQPGREPLLRAPRGRRCPARTWSGSEEPRSYLEAAPPQSQEGSGRIRRDGTGRDGAAAPQRPWDAAGSGHGFREGSEGPFRYRRGQPGRWVTGGGAASRPTHSPPEGSRARAVSRLAARGREGCGGTVLSRSIRPGRPGAALAVLGVRGRLYGVCFWPFRPGDVWSAAGGGVGTVYAHLRRDQRDGGGVSGGRGLWDRGWGGGGMPVSEGPAVPWPAPFSGGKWQEPVFRLGGSTGVARGQVKIEKAVCVKLPQTKQQQGAGLFGS